MRILFLVLTLVGFGSSGFSQTTATGSIRAINTGWNADAFSLQTREPIQNPAGCANPLGYESYSSEPGYNTNYAAALTAYMANLQVSVVIDDKVCLGPFPKIIGISLLR